MGLAGGKVMDAEGNPESGDTNCSSVKGGGDESDPDSAAGSNRQ